MNRNTMAGLILLGVALSLCVLVFVNTGQNPDQPVTSNNSQRSGTQTPELPHAPEGSVIASFGLDENNPERTVFLKNPALLDAFINASEKDAGPGNFPAGPVLGYVKDSDGSIVVLLNPGAPVNQTVINELYNNISARGRTFNISSVPCTFIRMDVVRID